MSDLPSQYAEEVETFRQILDLPNPREALPRSSTTVLGLDDEKGQQELRQRIPSAMLPLNPILKDAFEKFEQDFLASNLIFHSYFRQDCSSCNTVMDKCLHSAKATFKRVKNQIQKGVNPERAARRGYEDAFHYFELVRGILIQQRALANLEPTYSRGNYIPWATLAF